MELYHPLIAGFNAWRFLNPAFSTTAGEFRRSPCDNSPEGITGTMIWFTLQMYSLEGMTYLCF